MPTTSARLVLARHPLRDPRPAGAPHQEEEVHLAEGAHHRAAAVLAAGPVAVAQVAEGRAAAVPAAVAPAAAAQVVEDRAVEDLAVEGLAVEDRAVAAQAVEDLVAVVPAKASEM